VQRMERRSLRGDKAAGESSSSDVVVTFGSGTIKATPAAPLAARLFLPHPRVRAQSSNRTQYRLLTSRTLGGRSAA
jgi:hypothetical protein